LLRPAGALALTKEQEEILDARLMDRVMYQVTHVGELMQVYAKAAAAAQGDWFHIEGQAMLHKVAKMSRAKRKKQGKKLGLLSGKVPIPMFKFHKVRAARIAGPAHGQATTPALELEPGRGG
jgi:hypothetical protein